MKSLCGTRGFRAVALCVLFALGCSDSDEQGAGNGEPVPPEQTTVTIHRDTHGIPHVYAETVPALFYGFGYAVAQDRLFQADFYRRYAKGNLAAILGQDFVQSDAEMRTNFYTDAERMEQFNELDPEYRAMIQAYCDGFNRYIAEAEISPIEKKPLEYAVFGLVGLEMEPWDVTDILAITQMLYRYYGSEGGLELENLAFYNFLVDRYGEAVARTIFDDVLIRSDPDAYSTLPDSDAGDEGTSGTVSQAGILPRQSISRAAAAQIENSKSVRRALESIGMPRLGGSRGIAIAPGKSASGNVLMMHNTADACEVHLSGAGFEVSGFSFPGTPGVQMGRTRHLVTQSTVGFSDMIDVYIEQLNPGNPYQYFYDGEWRDMERRVEVIHVLGEAPVDLEVCRTVHGPVFEWDLENNIAYAKRFAVWGRELGSQVTAFEFNRAENYEEAAAAVRQMTVNVNVLYGDTEGNIAWWYPGLHPVRPESVDTRLPVPGTGEYEWQGFLPFEQWPHCKNPGQGYLLSWNNKPTPNHDYGDKARWGKTFRTYLPAALVEADASITWEEMLSMNRQIAWGWGGWDLTATSPEFFEPYLREAAQDSSDPRIREAVSRIADWDGLYRDADADGTYDSVGLTIFRKWVPVAERVLFEDDLGPWYAFDWCDYIKYSTDLLLRALEGQAAGQPMTFDYFNGVPKNTILLESLSETLAELAAEYGTEEMSRWKHPIFWREFDLYNMPGLSTLLGYVKNVPNNGMEDYFHLVELGHPDVRMVSAIPTGGQSWFISMLGTPSPHLTDQLWRHANFDFKTMHFDLPDILANLESTTELTYPPEAPAPQCFVATAAFGTGMGGKTGVLVRFRDDRLKKSEAGKAFVDLYYKYSPTAADLIRGRPWLKAVVRVLLLPLVGFVSLLV